MILSGLSGLTWDGGPLDPVWEECLGGGLFRSIGRMVDGLQGG